VMSDTFLEEQLKRIREMTEQMARLRTSTAEVCDASDRDRITARHNPQHEITDLRTASSGAPQRDRSDDHGRRQHSRHSSRARRK
jgi:hypothetical protein